MKGTVVLVSMIILTGATAQSMASSMSHPFVSEFGQSGLVKEGHFSGPQHIAIDSEGDLYVTDLGNRRVQKFDSSGQFELQWGSSGSGPGQFTAPAGIAASDGHIFVIDSRLDRVQRFAQNGTFELEWGSKGSGPAEFALPTGIAAHDSVLYVVDTGNHRVQTFDLNGTYISEFGTSGMDDDQFVSPAGVAIDPEGDIYVSDTASSSIKRFDSEGAYKDIIDGNVAGFEVKSHGLAVDASGNLYAADAGRDRIVLFGPDGMALSVWGSNGNGPGDFKTPRGLAIDADGHLYVVDSSGHRVQKFQTPAVQTEPEQTSEPEQADEVVDEPEPADDTVKPIPVPDDFVKPTIMVPPDITVEATGPKTPVSIGQAMATDASGIESLTHNAPDHFTLGQNSIIWTAIDGAGNLAIATQSVTVQDTTPPAVEPLPDITVEAKGPSGNMVQLDVPQASDALGVYSLESDAPDSFGLGTTTVTWTATDIVGNAGTATQTVHIVDTTPPQVHAPDDITAEASDGGIFVGQATVIDNGSIISVTNDAPDSYDIGTTTITWMAVDASGNSATDLQTVTIVDTTAPELGELQDIIVEAGSADHNAVEVPTPAAKDMGQVNVTGDIPDAFSIGHTVITWTATDESGNVVSASQTVTVQDTTAPKIVPPDDITVEATGQDGNVVDPGEPKVDDISPVSVTSNAPQTFELGETIIVWSAIDGYDNAATARQTVTVIDTTAPAITVPDDIAAEAASEHGATVELSGPAVDDNVQVESVTNDAPELFPLGDTTVTWTAVDTSGNTATASQTVRVQDTTPPVIMPPDDITVEASGPDSNSISLGSATAGDAVQIESITNDAPDAFALGTTTVTWTAVDASGNVATALQSVTVQDTTPPAVEAPADVTVEATSADQNYIDIGQATAADAIGPVTIDHDAPDAFALGTTTVTWTAVDASGNTARVSQTVTVQDTAPPGVAAPPDVVFEATDPSENIVDIGGANAADETGIESVTSDAPDVFALGTTTVTWTAVDASGNTATASQSVTVQDTTPPAVEAPADVTVEATSSSQNYIDIGQATAIDAIGPVTIDHDAPDAFPLGTTTVTWTAVDASGNVATASQSVIVQDTTAPIIVQPDDVTVEASGPDSNRVSLGSATTGDAARIETITNDAPDAFPLGVTIVTWTAVDESGNTATASQTVRVQDTTPPAVEAPADVTVEATSADQNYIDIGQATAADAIGPVTIDHDAPDAFALGATTVTWTATDASGNAATASQTVRVQDTTPPAVEAPTDVTVEAVSADQNYIDIGQATAIDATGQATIDHDAPDAFPLGATTVTWTATDASGNTATASQTVTVQDTTPPAIKAPADVTVEAVGMSNNTVQTGAAVAEDIIGVVSLTSDAPELFSLGQSLVTWTASDADRNAASAVQTVTIVDTTPPELILPQDIIIDATSPETAADIGAASSVDVIDAAPAISNDAPDAFGLGSTAVTWTSTDMFGNVASAVQTVTVQACGRPASSYNMITGTDGDDVLLGTDAADLVFALQGDDLVIGAGGNDCIFGGPGADIISGGAGADIISGGAGADILRGLLGDDLLDGGDGDDILDGGAGANSCVASGDDLTVRCQ